MTNIPPPNASIPIVAGGDSAVNHTWYRWFNQLAALLNQITAGENGALTIIGPGAVVDNVTQISFTGSAEVSGSSGDATVEIQGLPTAPSPTVLANIEGSGAYPVPVGVSALLDAALDNTWGDIIYRGQNGWTFLLPGDLGQVLYTGGPNANPFWGIRRPVLQAYGIASKVAGVFQYFLAMDDTLTTVLSDGTGT